MLAIILVLSVTLAQGHIDQQRNQEWNLEANNSITAYISDFQVYQREGA